MEPGRSFSSALSGVRAALSLLTPTERLRFWLVVAAQMATDLLDLVGVLLIGCVGVVAVDAVGSSGPQGRGTQVIQALGLDRFPAAEVAVWMALAAAAFFLTKSLLYGFLIAKNYSYLAKVQSSVSRRLLSSLLARPITDVHAMTPHETVYAVTAGALATITGLLGSVAIVVADFFLLILLAGTMFVFRPGAALAMAAYFALVGWIMHLTLSRWAARTRSKLEDSDVRVMAQVQEGIQAFRELWTMNRRDEYMDSVGSNMEVSARAQATSQLINQVPKLVYDCALVVGAVLLASWDFRSGDVSRVVGTLILFLAAGSRLVPSMLRLSGQLVNIRALSAQSAKTHRLANALKVPVHTTWRQGDSRTVSGTPTSFFRGDVEIDRVSVTYPGRHTPALRDVSLRIPAGTSLAIVGQTGAGKSTLADVIIGVLPPDEGRVRIGGLPTWEAIVTWPGQIAYLPQQVALFDATVRENVALALEPESVTDEQIWEALTRAQATEFVRSLPEGLHTEIGAQGIRLSGGQRQRIGLARGLLASPSVLVLDEATSALDAETEHAIAASIASLSGSVTAIVIAHRLATVRRVDAVAYLEGGCLRAYGSFDDVRKLVPSFDRQADLLGLLPDE